MELARLDFVRRKEDLVITGKTGTGKSHILQALGLTACQQQMYVRYARCVDLLDDLYAGLADATYPQRLKRWVAPDLLIIDDVGLGQIKKRDDDAFLAGLRVAFRGADKEVSRARLFVEDLGKNQIKELPERVLAAPPRWLGGQRHRRRHRARAARHDGGLLACGLYEAASQAQGRALGVHGASEPAAPTRSSAWPDGRPGCAPIYLAA